MLVSIRIKNYALIDNLELDMERGLSIITGETGAGKSILLGALGLLLGKRADTTVLKNTDKKCVVEGAFNIKDYQLENFFVENELDYSEETVIRREISSAGKSRAFINDTPVNLTNLQELTLSLVDIHSQHQNLSLNNAGYLRWIIDSYAGLIDDARAYKENFTVYNNLKKKYIQAKELYRDNQKNHDYLTHQFEELKAANLKTGELNELEKYADTLEHSTEIKTALESASHQLNSDEQGVLGTIKQILNQLEHIQQHLSMAEELFERTHQTYIELKDIDAEISRHSDRVDVDPQKLEEVNTRIYQLNTLLNKHKCNTVDELIELRDKYDEQLQKFANSDYELEQLKDALDKKEGEVNVQAQTLSGDRSKCFVEFEQRIQELLHNMGMKNAVFQVQQITTELSVAGIDDIQFYFSANQNIAPQSIARVASGGELSRLMLAVKYLISGASGLPTIIFDEIDAGVSGEIADKMGKLIKEMAGDMQVINITHLPQVAGKGDHHYSVYKSSTNGTSYTGIRKLNNEERLAEIARMLSGDKVTDAAIANARVLLGS